MCFTEYRAENMLQTVKCCFWLECTTTHCYRAFFRPDQEKTESFADSDSDSCKIHIYKTNNNSWMSFVKCFIFQCVKRSKWEPFAEFLSDLMDLRGNLFVVLITTRTQTHTRQVKKINSWMVLQNVTCEFKTCPGPCTGLICWSRLMEVLDEKYAYTLLKIWGIWC